MSHTFFVPVRWSWSRRRSSRVRRLGTVASYLSLLTVSAIEWRSDAAISRHHLDHIICGNHGVAPLQFQPHLVQALMRKCMRKNHVGAIPNRRADVFLPGLTTPRSSLN